MEKLTKTIKIYISMPKRSGMPPLLIEEHRTLGKYRKYILKPNYENKLSEYVAYVTYDEVDYKRYGDENGE